MSGKNGAKILIVDDSSVNNYLLENILEEKGYTLQIAFDGKEALNFLNEDPPDLVLLDIMMPGIDGYEILDKMTSDNKLKNIPVIMVTSKTEPQDKQKAMDIGAIDYIEKPIDIETLLIKVENVLKKLV
ncbi:MAG: response regulator [Bacteroidales bacterium]|nr:response regulator [Bacteroidales bacterium]